jgi:hypothetical protein
MRDAVGTPERKLTAAAIPIRSGVTMVAVPDAPRATGPVRSPVSGISTDHDVEDVCDSM